MATKFISDLGPKSALIAPRPFSIMASQHKVFFGESERGCSLEQSIYDGQYSKICCDTSPPPNPKPKQVRLEWLSTDNLSNPLYA